MKLQKTEFAFNLKKYLSQNSLNHYYLNADETELTQCNSKYDDIIVNVFLVRVLFLFILFF